MSPTPPTSTPSSPALKPSVPDETHDLAAVCLYCHIREPIYTCPGCYTRTCSVACVKRHKKYKQCSGERDPTAYVKRSKLMTESGINRDFNFLTKLDREVARRLEEDERRLVVEGEDGERGVRGRKEEFGKVLRERATTVVWAPWEGFERARENKTTFTKGGKISWTVEWVLAEESNRRIREHHVGEQKGVIQAIRDSTVLPMEWRHFKKIKFYLVLQSPANKKLCTLISKAESLKQALRHQTVQEYPDILLSTEETPEGWEVVETRKIVELEEPATGETAVVEGKKKAKRGGRGKRKAGADGPEEVTGGDQQPAEEKGGIDFAVVGENSSTPAIPAEPSAAASVEDTTIDGPATKKARID